MKTESRVIQQALPDTEVIELEVAQAVSQTPPLPRTFKKRRFHDRELKGLTLSDCFFIDCHFERVTFEGCDLRAVRFEGCTLNQVNVVGGSLLRLSFNECRFDNLTLQRGLLCNLACNDTTLRGGLHRRLSAGRLQFDPVRGQRGGSRA
ncbi:pentapeptide repeat-containing protein [Serratia sp. SSNIH3]|uniref:pentapeptide repeat-containing protein n=1 Tax=Serratia sp. SSNIH3 TaxID=1920111 RepID=UPI001E5733EA|nr:pentapeptide repeat-containing protein [Serratia sp. SSNIH3]